MTVISRGVAVGPVGVPVRRRALLVAAVVLLLLTGLAAAAVLLGTVALPAGRILATLAGDGSRIENLVVLERRLPRMLAAVLVGFALGSAGALTQSITRNPIASPDILGVTSGAAVFAVLLLTWPGLTGTAASVLLAPAAVAGGLLTTAVVLGLSWRAGFDGLRLILVGLAVNALALAVVAWLLTRADLLDAQLAARWLTGSLDAVRPADLRWLGPAVLLAVPVCAVLAKDLAAVRMSREVAVGLGTDPARTEIAALTSAVLLVSVATAVAGPVGFVGFVAPQAALRLFGTAGPPPLAGGLVGATLVLSADLAAQRLPEELPVGVLTTVLGAPSLLSLLLRTRRTRA